MIDWNYIQDFLGFALTGAISFLGVLGIIAISFLVVMFFVVIGFMIFTYIDERLK